MDEDLYSESDFQDEEEEYILDVYDEFNPELTFIESCCNSFTKIFKLIYCCKCF